MLSFIAYAFQNYKNKIIKPYKNMYKNSVATSVIS